MQCLLLIVAIGVGAPLPKEKPDYDPTELNKAACVLIEFEPPGEPRKGFELLVGNLTWQYISSLKVIRRDPRVDSRALLAEEWAKIRAHPGVKSLKPLKEIPQVKD
jgi:hypothetical protein